MSVQYVEPVRYQDGEIAPAKVKRNVGFKRWLVVFGTLALSWYMYGIGAIAYSSVLFMLALLLVILNTAYLAMTKPKTVDDEAQREHQRRMKLLDKWSK